MKRRAPAVQRNRDAIAAVLEGVLPPAGLVLEIASGTGEHAVHFAATFPGLMWQPSDPDPGALDSIKSWSSALEIPNILPPLMLDAGAGGWPIARADAILCINMIHISPWSATCGLMAGAARLLPQDGLLFLYGPYRQAGVPTAPSNETFDLSLKQRNPQWGLRHLDDVVALAADAGFALERSVTMPANNLSLIFRYSRRA